MRLRSISVTPHPSGNRIDLSWVNPDPSRFPGVRVVRRERTHPASPDDGVVVAEGLGLPFTPNTAGEGVYAVSDTGLKGETVYYYTLFPYASEPPDYQVDMHNQASAMATASYDMAGQMYVMLPAVYHRYDSALSNGDGGRLQRFLDLPGSQLDLLYSFARAALNLYDIDRVEGRLLPLLAQWIGWNTNYRLDVATQRNELRSAPHLYRTISILPTVEATVKRVLGWESHAKEFVHNVALSNSPERLNIWMLRRGANGAWLPWIEPLSLDFAYEGHVSAATDPDGVLWLFFHTLRNGRWDIWRKNLTMFVIPASLAADLDAGSVTLELQQAFGGGGFPISQEARIEKASGIWRVADPQSGAEFSVRVEAGALTVYRWTPSQRLTNEPTVDKHPAIIFHNGTLLVFWDSYDAEAETWRVLYRSYSAGVWGPVATFGNDGADQKSPSLLVDHTSHLWAFWLQRDSGHWRMRYLRQGDGGEWDVRSAHLFPDDGGADPRVDSDLFALFQSAAATPDATPRIWVFWSRTVPLTGGQTGWQIAYRAATAIDPSEITWIHSWSPDFTDHLAVDTTATPVDLSFRTYYVNKPLDWSAIFTLPESPGNFSVREPAAFINPDGALELFFSSNRGGSWSIWRRLLQAIDPPTWEVPERLTTGPYSQRAPFPCVVGDGSLLLYRSNESVRYASAVYRATKTLDARYAGSTTVDTGNRGKIALREHFDDFQTYTYDVGRGDQNWYARDTVGIYLDADTEDQRTIISNRNLINNVLRQFLPAQVRVVFIIPIITREWFYTYSFSSEEPQRRIGEEYADHLEAPSSEFYGGLADEHTDTMVDWVFAYFWSVEHPEAVTVDTNTVPVDTNWRTWHVGLSQGG